MEIYASCIFDFNSIRALSYVAMFKKMNPKLVFHITNILSVLMIVLSVLMINLYGSSENNRLLGLSIAILILNLFMYLAFPRIQYSALKKFKNTKQEYLFCDEHIKISTQNESYSGAVELKYNLIHKVMESSEYLFIFQTKNQAYVVDKSSVANGAIDSIRQKLLESVGAKYTLCKY